MTPRPAASARVPRWRVDASRAVSPRACLGGAGGPPGTQVGLLGPGCAAVPVPGGRVGQKIPAQYTLLTHTVYLNMHLGTPSIEMYGISYEI